MRTRTAFLVLVSACLVAWAAPGAVRAQGGDPFGSPKGGATRPLDPDEQVKVSLVASKATANAGDQIVLAVVMDHAPTFHSWPHKPVLPPELGDDFGAIPTTIALTGAPEGVAQVGPIQWPAPHAVRVDFGGGPMELISYSGKAIAYIPVILSASATAGERTFEATVGYQACDDKVCYPPQRVVVRAGVDIVPQGRSAPAVESSLFSGFDPTVFARMLAGEVSAEPAGGARSDFDFFGARFSLANNAYALILLIAFVAGFLLNLTPCVLPVIPIKVISLQKQAGNPATLALNGLVYCLGIVATFAVFGLMIFGIVSGGQRQEWGQIFSQAWFTIAMAVIVGVLGLGMMGLFTVRLPKAVYMVNPSLDSVHGNFLFGVLTAILSTPCTGPFLGATIAWATKQPPWMGLATLIVMGVGMAAPYAALIAFPKLIDRLPKAGPGGELLKQVMGLFLLAVAAFLGANVTEAKWPWWIVAGFAGLACVWAAAGAWRVLRSGAAKVAITLAAAGGLAGTWWAARALTSTGPIPWVAYSPDVVARARAAGKIVVIDFTAKWCTNCHVLEKTVLAQPPVVGILNEKNVVPVKVDLTSADNTEGWTTLKAISDSGGIPLTAIYLPGRDQPVLFRSFYTGAAFEEAVRGARAAAAGGH